MSARLLGGDLSTVSSERRGNRVGLDVGLEAVLVSRLTRVSIAELTSHPRSGGRSCRPAGCGRRLNRRTLRRRHSVVRCDAVLAAIGTAGNVRLTGHRRAKHPFQKLGLSGADFRKAFSDGAHDAVVLAQPGRAPFRRLRLRHVAHGGEELGQDLRALREWKRVEQWLGVEREASTFRKTSRRRPFPDARAGLRAPR